MKHCSFLAKALAFFMLFYQTSCTPAAPSGSTPLAPTAFPSTMPNATNTAPEATATPSSASVKTPVDAGNGTKAPPKETATRPGASIRATKLHQWVLPDPQIDDIKWTLSGDRFVVLTLGGVTMYDASTYQELWSIPPIAPAYYASGTAFLPDGKSFILYIDPAGLKYGIPNPAGCWPKSRSTIIPATAFNRKHGMPS